MSRYYNSSKKKIRGWKRRIRQIHKWGQDIKVPYLKYFISDKNSHTYTRCYLYPFYTLDKRHPPLWFYKLIISKFINTFFEWEKVFNELAMPYDLQLWLYDPAYIRSEITCYRMNEEGEQKSFVWESEENKAFPYNKFACPLFDLKQFDWIFADDQDVIFEDDIEFYETTADQLILDGFIKKVQGDNEVYFAKKVGDIWIGRRKGKMANKKIIQPYFAPPKFLGDPVVNIDFAEDESTELSEKEFELFKSSENDAQNGRVNTYTNHRQILAQ